VIETDDTAPLEAHAAPDADLRLNDPVLPTRPTRKLGRPKAQSADLTRERILNEAERLFAEGGYDGTSIRDVAAAADCQIQAIGYHFGQKEQLFDTVVARRAQVMSEMRVESLRRLKAAAGDAPVPLESLVRAYVRPFIASAQSGDPGWRNFAALMGRLANSKLGTAVIARHYNVVAREYVAEFRRTLPTASERSIVEGVLFMVAAMLAICADTGRADDLSDIAEGSVVTDRDLDRLVAFVVGGLNALAPISEAAPA
jgi:AcrR family transcriptional regulator